jgi:glycerol-3-phosphate dehydrogenase
MVEAMKDHIAIIGAGAWGTALAIQAHRAGQHVMLWARDPARAKLIEQSRANERLLPGVTLPEGISVTADAAQALPCPESPHHCPANAARNWRRRARGVA